MKRQAATFKAQVILLEIVREEKSVMHVATEHGVHLRELHRWKRQVFENFSAFFIQSEAFEHEAHGQQLAGAHCP